MNIHLFKKPFYLTTVLLLFFNIVSYAQIIQIKVIDNKTKQPLEGAIISVNKKRVGNTDNEGKLSINVKPNEDVTARLHSYLTSTLKFTNQNSLLFSLDADIAELEVVTAFGIKRSKPSLTYSAPVVNGKDLEATQRSNFVNALQGRVSGLTISPTNGLAGSSSQIVLRGFNSLFDNTPLFVINGVIVDNSSVQENDPNTGLVGGRGENRQNDYSNRINDLNPDDIESITVLKGPEAAALYGSQASSGALIITTKKGVGNNKVNVYFNPNFGLSRFQNLPTIFYGYGPGVNGQKGDVLGSYFGPKLADTATRYDNINNFFGTGYTNNYIVAADYGKPNLNFRVSFNYFDQGSPIPNNNYIRTNGSFSGNYKYKNIFDVNLSYSLSTENVLKPLRGVNGFLQGLYQWPETNDARNWQNADGSKTTIFNFYTLGANGETDNPYFSANRVVSGENTFRQITTLGINIRPTNWLTLSGFFGYDNYRQTNYTRYDSASIFILRSQRGYMDYYLRNYYGYNHTLTATFQKSVKTFDFKVILGNTWQNYETQIFTKSGAGLLSFQRTDPDNITTAILYNNNYIRTNADGDILKQPNYSIYRQVAYFGEFSFNWDKKIFFNATARFEENSVFPAANRNYAYPSFGLSFIMTELFPTIKSENFNYWKLRAATANTARAVSPYSNQAILEQNTGSGGGFKYGFTKANQDLKPERQETFEIGTEFGFFKNKLNLEISYYQNTNRDLIFQNFRASYGTGFILNTLNVGVNQNRGIEINLDYFVFQKKNFEWRTRFNFSKIESKILELYYNVPELYNSDTWVFANARNGLFPGGSSGTITGFKYLRDEYTGKIIIDRNTGLPRLANTFFRNIGDRIPDFTLGWVNNFTIYNFTVSMLWDLKVGGDVINLTEMYLTRLGRSTRTADRLTSRVVDGILDNGVVINAEGKAYVSVPIKNTIVVTPYYLNNYYTNLPEEEFVQKSVNWFRLRDITIAYNFSPNLLKKSKIIRNFSIYTTITDPILFTNYSGGDPQVSVTGAGSRGTGGWGFDFLNVGAPFTVNFGIKASF